MAYLCYNFSSGTASQINSILELAIKNGLILVEGTPTHTRVVLALIFDHVMIKSSDPQRLEAAINQLDSIFSDSPEKLETWASFRFYHL